MLRKNHILIAALLILNFGCKLQPEETTNQLAHASSPYLQQHAHNPVNWYPWGDEALEKAKTTNKPIIVSVGYAACHWCHVMEKESFENDSIAQYMNEHFVSIKVDREERPDIDQIYMEAAQLMSGRGGWPLNCITLPDGRPFFCGTYFPKDAWMDVLKQIVELYNNNPDQLRNIAIKVTEGVNTLPLELAGVADRKANFQPTLLDSVYQNWAAEFDTETGGFQGAPKFPVPNSFQALLQYHFYTQSEQALNQVKLTLNNMANGGIYDHLGGGFARYSTDGQWKVPHFEKMLYDNAQLVSLYSEAYQVTKDESYRTVVYETLAFIKREMTSPEGGFYSSLDADSEGEEGKYYVWTEAEIDKLLGEKADIFKKVYNIQAEGNWEEGKNILYRTRPATEIASELNIPVDELGQSLRTTENTLLEARQQRVRPGLDDKLLTSWNALMIQGCTDAYMAFGEERFLQAALDAGQFLLENSMYDDHRLNRNCRKDAASVNGFLDDYAYTIRAFIALYQVTFDESWLYHAKDLMQYVTTHFPDEESGYFFYTSDQDPALIARKVELFDNVLPSSNAIMAHNLFLLGHYFYNESHLEQARLMLSGVLPQLSQSPRFFANWLQLLMQHTYPFYEVAIVGKDYGQKLETMHQTFLPAAILLGGKNEGSLELLTNKLATGETYIYVCQDKVCQFPVTEARQALGQILNTKSSL